jgi:hypothetical protein
VIVGEDEKNVWPIVARRVRRHENARQSQ